VVTLASTMNCLTMYIIEEIIYIYVKVFDETWCLSLLCFSNILVGCCFWHSSHVSNKW